MAKKAVKKSSAQLTKTAPPKLPPGVKLLRTLRGHTGWIGRIAWSPDGRRLASPSADKTVRLWDARTGECLRIIKGHTSNVYCVAFNPTGTIVASAGYDVAIRLWNAESGELLHTLEGATQVSVSIVFDPMGDVLASAGSGGNLVLWDLSAGATGRRLPWTLKGDDQLYIMTVAFDPAGHILASGGQDRFVNLRDFSNGFDAGPDSGRLLCNLEGHQSTVKSVAFDPAGRILASGSEDKTVKLWDLSTPLEIGAVGRRLRGTLEGHTGQVNDVIFLFGGRLLASKGSDGDVRLWNSETGTCLAVIPGLGTEMHWQTGLAFHPTLPLLATVGSDPGTPDNDDIDRGSDTWKSGGLRDRVIHIWELDLAALLNQAPAIKTSHYINAKVVLLGDTGVGKSGLSLVLNGQPFVATDSTPGRKVWTLQSQEVELKENLKQTREALLWDLAGQPGYRVIHQLHLNEVAVALVVFDARSETDPLAGVRHWERALRLAQQRQGTASPPVKKFLVSARVDRGAVSVSKERLDGLLKEYGFEEYFETSAKEGWQIKELRRAIEDAIPWELLPEVSSSVLFADIKAFLLDVKKTGQLVALASQLYDDFARAHQDAVAAEPNLRDQFATCIGRLENRDLIRRLSFGGYVLLQPELLDAYASAMVNAAKEEPDGLGSIAEDAALVGQFFVPKEQKIADPGQQQLLLHSTVEELVSHDLALRENAADGRYLVFPSQFNRDYEDAPEPKGKALAVTFDGPVQSLYSTLAVRLGHSGLFTTGRVEMWRNAAVFTAKAGGKCGLYLHEFAEARGRLIIFYDQSEGQLPSDETRFNFEEFVLAHARRRALDNTVELVRFFICAGCGNPVPDAYVKMLRGKGEKVFDCPCGRKVSLEEPKEKLHFASKVEAMDKSADRQRDFEMFLQSARGETSTPSFTEWAGGERVMLAIVFTDVVRSTPLGEELKDERMNEVRRAHFAKSRALIDRYQGREIKTIGDSFMAAFRCVEEALDYATALHAEPGAEQLKIRAGIHSGPMTVEEDDVFGSAVTFAARVVGVVKEDEIWLSDRAKSDLVSCGARRHENLTWDRHDNVTMKGFPGTFTLWSLRR